MQLLKTHKGWDAAVISGDCAPPWLEANRRDEYLSRLIDRLDKPDRVIKSDHRSFVGVLEFEGDRLIVKRFTRQASWFWFRLTSLFFPSLGEIAFSNAVGLTRAGVLTPQPLALLQERKRGSVKYDWLVYRYLEGEALSPGDGADIAAYLRRMHDAGWVHRDPHTDNFIRAAQGVATLDTLRVLPSRNVLRRAYDLARLEANVPEAVDLYGGGVAGFALLLARLAYRALGLYQRVKRRLRSILGLKNPG